MALSFFPQPYPDEIMYSIIARYHHISGNTSKALSMIDLFNYEYIVPSIALQTRLGVLAANSKRFGMHFDTLLFEHTLFPYLMVFTRPDSYDRVYNWAKYPDNRSDRFATGAIHRNIYPEMMMYCPECAKDDTLLFGEAYWHRMHQSPGIPICRKHRCTLLSSNIQTFYHGIGHYQILREESMQAINPPKLQYGYNDFIHTEGIFDDTNFLYDNFIRVRKLFTDYNYCFREAFLPALIKQNLATRRTLKNKEFIESSLSLFSWLLCFGMSRI